MLIPHFRSGLWDTVFSPFLEEIVQTNVFFLSFYSPLVLMLFLKLLCYTICPLSRENDLIDSIFIIFMCLQCLQSKASQINVAHQIFNTKHTNLTGIIFKK